MRQRSARAALTVGLACGALAAIGASSAQAGNYLYCSGTFGAYGGCESTERHSMISNMAYDFTYGTHSVGVGAADSNNNAYGSIVYGNGSRCHPYSGQNLLYAIMVNGTTATFRIDAYMGYGNGPASC